MNGLSKKKMEEMIKRIDNGESLRKIKEEDYKNKTYSMFEDENFNDLSNAICNEIDLMILIRRGLIKKEEVKWL